MSVVVATDTTPLAVAAVRHAAKEATLRDLPLVLVSYPTSPRTATAAATFQQRGAVPERVVARHAEELREHILVTASCPALAVKLYEGIERER